MRNLLLIGLMLVAAFMAGWFKIQRDGDRTTIEIDRGEIRSDASKAINRGREFLDRQDQQYADQQQYDQQDQVYWPEQIATQPEPWGTIQQQSFDGQVDQAGRYVDPNYYPQYQTLPNQPRR